MKEKKQYLMAIIFENLTQHIQNVCAYFPAIARTNEASWPSTSATAPVAAEMKLLTRPWSQPSPLAAVISTVLPAIKISAS